MGPKMEKHPLIEKGKLRLLAWANSEKSCLPRRFQKSCRAYHKCQKTRFNHSFYDVAWGKRDSWCSRKQVDSISGPPQLVLDFLAELFHSGLEWSTIASYRSSILAFDDPIEGFSVVKHPRVCSLIKGIFNKRTSLPKYKFIWDVQKVLNYLSSVGMPEHLNDKMLTLETLCL